MTASTLPRLGSRIRVEFRGNSGHLNSRYIGTVTAADSHGVELADVDVYDDVIAVEVGQEHAHWQQPEIGVAWPTTGSVHVYKTHGVDCIGSCCHDYS